MIPLISGIFTFVGAFFYSRYHLGLEILALRQQLGVLKRKHPRPRLRKVDRLFWIFLRRIWPAWINALIIVKPETVVSWHRAGFRLFWRLRSRTKQDGRPKIDKKLRDIIYKMVNENPTWGAPRIHGELLKLGFDVSERTISRYIRRISPSDQSRKLWTAFLRNHREAITAMDFFTVPTVAFRVLYCFFVIEHSRRRILHFNVTDHPTGSWIAQQLREAFSESNPYHYVILDRDAKFGTEVHEILKASGMNLKRTSPASPWQNGVAERWIGSCRRELLDHVIALNESHLRRLIRDYIAYYNWDRTHDSLDKDSPAIRQVTNKPENFSAICSIPRVGGLHHRYDWKQAA
jgi:transposase InsO family protein